MVLTHLTVSFKSQSQNATVVPARAVDGALETPNLILKSKPTAVVIWERFVNDSIAFLKIKFSDVPSTIPQQ